MRIPLGIEHGLARLSGRRLALTVLGSLAALGLTGCKTETPYTSQTRFSETSPAGGHHEQAAAPAASEEVLLREGDTVRIAFPGSPTLNTVQQIRRDGKLSLAMVGEVQAAGVTPSQLQKTLVKLYSPQLVDKEVNVALESSAFQVFVTGAVARPGKLISERPLTALEAVIDAGIDYQKANLKSVRIIRHENGQEKIQILNLQKALEGSGGEPFYLKPSDIIFVRERFTWF